MQSSPSPADPADSPHNQLEEATSSGPHNRELSRLADLPDFGGLPAIELMNLIGAATRESAARPGLNDEFRETFDAIADSMESLSGIISRAFEQPAGEGVPFLSREYHRWYHATFCSVPDIADISARFPRFLLRAHHFNMLASRSIEPADPLYPVALIRYEVNVAAMKTAASWWKLDPTPAWLSSPILCPLLKGLNGYYSTLREILVGAGCVEIPLVMPDRSIRLRLMPPILQGSINIAKLDVCGVISRDHVRKMIKSLRYTLKSYLILPELTPAPGESPSEARNRFCYERRRAGDQDKEIMARVNRTSGWEPFETPQGVIDAADAHSRRLGEEPYRKRRRKSGNPAENS